MSEYYLQFFLTITGKKKPKIYRQITKSYWLKKKNEKNLSRPVGII